MELNPNNAALNTMREYWYKVAALLLAKLGGHAVITTADMDAIEGRAIVLDCKTREDAIITRIVSIEEGEALAKKEGGLPV